jgi:multidrug resistance efflux pump
LAFPATAVAVADANTLDDYEEGTWTGTLTATTTGPTVAVTSTGRYTKIGRQVTVHIEFNVVSTSGAAGNILITGIPFTSAATYSSYGVVGLVGNGTAASISLLPASSTTINFVDAVTGAAIAIVAGTGKYYYLTLTYHV